MKKRILPLIGLVGAIIPCSLLITRYFALPSNGFFGAVLPTAAAIAVVGSILYLFVCSRNSGHE
jgi:hypothetical protein